MRTIADTAFIRPPNKVPLIEAHTHAFMVSRYREPTFHFNWHYHSSEVELTWIRQGSGLRYVGRSVEPFKTGDLVLLGNKLPHTWGSATDQQDHSDWTVIQFECKRWGDDFWKMPELRELRALLDQAQSGIQFIGPRVQHIGELMEKLATRRPYSLEGLALFIDIFHLLSITPARCLNAGPVQAGSAQPDPRLQQVLALVDELGGDHLLQAEVAARVKMGSAVFCRWFKQRMGRNFQRYLNEVRVARVCAHLADGNGSITSVAMDCGFNSMANFNRRFREITGLTPRDFRAKTRAICSQSANKLAHGQELHRTSVGLI
jgi:AraC-like DNA-binding protein